MNDQGKGTYFSPILSNNYVQFEWYEISEITLSTVRENTWRRRVTNSETHLLLKITRRKKKKGLPIMASYKMQKDCSSYPLSLQN